MTSKIGFNGVASQVYHEKGKTPGSNPGRSQSATVLSLDMITTNPVITEPVLYEPWVAQTAQKAQTAAFEGIPASAAASSPSQDDQELRGILDEFNDDPTSLLGSSDALDSLSDPAQKSLNVALENLTRYKDGVDSGMRVPDSELDDRLGNELLQALYAKNSASIPVPSQASNGAALEPIAEGNEEALSPEDTASATPQLDALLHQTGQVTVSFDERAFDLPQASQGRTFSPAGDLEAGFSVFQPEMPDLPVDPIAAEGMPDPSCFPVHYAQDYHDPDYLATRSASNGHKDEFDYEGDIFNLSEIEEQRFACREFGKPALKGAPKAIFDEGRWKDVKYVKNLKTNKFEEMVTYEHPKQTAPQVRNCPDFRKW